MFGGHNLTTSKGRSTIHNRVVSTGVEAEWEEGRYLEK
jgi:hypothetical protein